MNVLVAGIGNIFMGDDGFGCEVARRLANADMPEGVDVVDFGIRGMDLGYALMDGYDSAILIDTACRGDTPGTVYVVEPELNTMAADIDKTGEPLIAPHDMDPEKVLRLVASLGDRRPRVLLVACEPAYLGAEQGHMGLSEAAEGAVEQAISDVLQILHEWSGDDEARRRVSA